MRSRILVGALLLIVGLSAGSLFAGAGPKPALQWAMVNFSQPTMIAGTLVVGPVMFTHDDAKMKRGEACTTVHRFWPSGPAEKLAEFHCKPQWGQAPGKFTMEIKQDQAGPQVLGSYQFAGDAEAHAVPAMDMKH